MTNLLLMPDEIKIKIFEYLNGTDKIQLLKVCKDFRRIGVDRQLIEELDFSKNYKLLFPQLQYLASKSTALIVTHLNLNGIYWIPSRALKNVLINFINLSSLFVLDTILTYTDLIEVLNRTTEVKRLAISMKAKDMSDILQHPITLPLTHFYVDYYPKDFSVLLVLFIEIETLEELWIIEPKVPLGEDLPWTNYLDASRQRVSDKIVFSRQYGPTYTGQTFLDSLKEKQWQVVKNYSSRKVTFYILEPIGLEPEKWNLEIWDEVTISLRNLPEDIHSSGKYILTSVVTEEESSEDLYIKDADDINNSKKKFHLFSENARFIWRMKCTSDIFWSQNRKHGKFKKFAEIATEIQDFEIEDLDSKEDGDNLWNIEELIFIRNWKILRRLVISSVNIKNGKFIVEITKSCSFLEILKIQDENNKDNLTKDLSEALEYAKNLKDFRYQRKGSIEMDILLEALVQCRKIERVYLQGKYVVQISTQFVESVIKNCENLIFLFIYISELPESYCMSCIQSLRKLEVKPQHIICIKGKVYNLENIVYECIPHYLVEEMVCQSSEPYRDYLQLFFH